MFPAWRSSPNCGSSGDRARLQNLFWTRSKPLFDLSNRAWSLREERVLERE
jgi:hypothetical protein